MANIGDITCSENADDFAAETSNFLKDSDISALEKSFDAGGLKNVNRNINSEIKSQMKLGLSLDSLNINGRAPLNELSEELLARLNVSIEDIDVAKKIVRAEGNRHRKEEASRYWEEVQKTLEKLKEKTQSAVGAYNDATASYNTKVRQHNSEHPDDKKSYRTKLLWNDSNNFDCISNIGDIDSGAPHSGDVKKAYEKLGEFQKKYDEAKKLLNECNSLSPDSVAGYRISVPEGEKTPAGVQTGAKRQSIETDSTGGRKDVYTNPDGSRVEVTYKYGSVKTSTVTKNRYGYVMKETKYDSNGKETGQVEYKYRKTDTKGVYNRITVENGKSTGEEKYSYVDAHGNYQVSNEKPKTTNKSKVYYDHGDYTSTDFGGKAKEETNSTKTTPKSNMSRPTNEEYLKDWEDTNVEKDYIERNEEHDDDWYEKEERKQRLRDAHS